MIEDGEVRPEGYICEPYSDIPPNWKDIRTEFGYTKLSEIMGRNIINEKSIGIYIIKKMLRATNMVNITDNRTTLGFESKQWQMAVVIL